MLVMRLPPNSYGAAWSCLSIIPNKHTLMLMTPKPCTFASPVPIHVSMICPDATELLFTGPVQFMWLLSSASSFLNTFEPITLALLTTILTLPNPVFAAANATTEAAEHLHVGQKIANYFRTFGLPDLAIPGIVSAIPVVELRGAIPVGVWMGLPIAKVLPVCVLGNMVPIVPLMFLLRNERLKKLISPILSRAKKKSTSLGVGSVEEQWASIAAFIGIPLPGTGAWTGAMGEFLVGMPTAVALSSIFTGMVAAGCIMGAVTLVEKKSGIGEYGWLE